MSLFHVPFPCPFSMSLFHVPFPCTFSMYLFHVPFPCTFSMYLFHVPFPCSGRGYESLRFVIRQGLVTSPTTDSSPRPLRTRHLVHYGLINEASVANCELARRMLENRRVDNRDKSTGETASHDLDNTNTPRHKSHRPCRCDARGLCNWPTPIWST